VVESILPASNCGMGVGERDASQKLSSFAP
jgi:hypothetical protein